MWLPQDSGRPHTCKQMWAWNETKTKGAQKSRLANRISTPTSSGNVVFHVFKEFNESASWLRLLKPSQHTTSHLWFLHGAGKGGNCSQHEINGLTTISTNCYRLVDSASLATGIACIPHVVFSSKGAPAHVSGIALMVFSFKSPALCPGHHGAVQRFLVYQVKRNLSSSEAWQKPR